MQDQHKQMYALCKQYMHSYVQAELSDGTGLDGIITGLDDENIYLAVPTMSQQYRPNESSDTSTERQFGGGYPGYGYGYGYGGPSYGYPRPRPFQRVIVPLIALTALSLLPWY